MLKCVLNDGTTLMFNNDSTRYTEYNHMPGFIVFEKEDCDDKVLVLAAIPKGNIKYIWNDV